MPIKIVKFRKADTPGLPAKTLQTVRFRMARDGAVVFDNLFPLGLLERARREVVRRHNKGELREHGLVRDIGGRYAAVLPFEGPFLEREFYANAKLLDILAALLGTHYCIGSLEAVIAEPGASRQHQHIDGPLRFDQVIGKSKRGFPGDLSGLPPYAVTLCVPLCDINEENGPTAIWRGSHRLALQSRFPSESRILREFPVEHMEGSFGRSFLFDFRTFHGGMPNDSREPRPLLMFVFTRSWFRDPNLADVAPNVVISKKNLARIPERHRDLFQLAPHARRRLWENR